MPKRDWRTAGAYVALGLIVLAIAFLLVWDVSADLAEQRVRDIQRAQTQAEQTSNRIAEECTTTEPVALRECIQQQVETAAETYRAQQDLRAQQTMAFFTKVMGFTGLVGLVIGGVSVALIWLTVRETQRMAADTRDIGEAQIRAYLTIKNMSLAFNDSYTSPRVQMTLANTGQSPAREIEVVFRFSFFPKVEGALEDLPHLPERYVRWWFDDVAGGEDAACKPSVLSDVRLSETRLGQKLECLVGVHFSVAVFAKDVFNKEITTFGHFAVGWGQSEDRRSLQLATDLTQLYPSDLMIEQLRPYRLGGEKDGQG